jgi:hypothetical protein
MCFHTGQGDMPCHKCKESDYDGNRWRKMVGHRGCTYPCSGEPVLKTRPDGPFVGAHRYPVYLQCSNCGYAPFREQPELVKRYLERYDMPIVGKEKQT